MNLISKDVALKFCETCNWVYESWIVHKYLFDFNDKKESNIGKSKYFTSRLSIITQEYSLQQISKLHDPAIQRNSLNLTIDYIVRFGVWDSNKDKILDLKSNLDDLWSHIKPARNKILSHNDFETILENQVMGAFPEDKDEQYFKTLQELVNLVHDKWIGGLYPFNDLAISDVDEFLALLDEA
jgi:HEPN superfamily AbiU2-like protein